MNTSLVLSFVLLFLLLGNTAFSKQYSFIKTISDFAKVSETKTFNVTVSAGSKEQYQELLTFNGASINNHDIYDNSLLATPDQNNHLELVLGEYKIAPTTFTLRTLFSYKQSESDIGFKLESDNLYINRTELNNPPGTKSISVTESVAKKIANFTGGTDSSSALGQVLELNYFDFALDRVSVPVFIKSIVLKDVGIMPTYETNYGDDLIFLAANLYDYNVVGSRLDVRYSQSIYRNLLHTNALIEEFGADRMSFINNNFLTMSQIENINAGYHDAFGRNDVLENPFFITSLVLFLLSASFTVLCLILYFRNYNGEGRKHNIVSITPFLISLIVSYTITTILNFIMRDDVAAGAYLTAPRSFVFIVFLVIAATITLLPSKNKGIEIDEEDKN